MRTRAGASHIRIAQNPLQRLLGRSPYCLGAAQGKASPRRPEGFPPTAASDVEDVVDEPHDHRPVADRPGHAVGRAGADVTGHEYARASRLEHVGLSV